MPAQPMRLLRHNGLVLTPGLDSVTHDEHLDVLIVGAGLSGIGAACHLRRECPGKSYAILEARDSIGGTWDLFRYPGIRSDSDMFTLGYSFAPWRDAKAIADGPSILDYIHEAAREHDVERRIRFGHRAVRAEWSSEDARWTVEVERADDGESVRLTCGFLLVCTGYYRYDEGYTPEFEGTERFRAASSTPSTGPRTSTTPASAWWSSAAGRPRSRSCPRSPSGPLT